MKKKYKKIHWLDHCSDATWKTKEELAEWAKKPTICTTIGELTYEDKNVIILSASFDGEKSYGENIMIFKKNIVK